MKFVYKEQELELDPQKINPYGNSFTYEDVLLCNEKQNLCLQYQHSEVVVTTKEFQPFQNVQYPQMSVKIQFLTAQQVATLNFLQRIDFRLTNSSNDGDVNFSFPRDQIVEKLSKAILPYIH
ncbi:hypothetical protein [Acinetobacter baumannii]|uniref:hypothetical protein n=1 Tax=Acinetobacter baumannii TaxID=470 RepID=UPI000B93FAA8|nr:hypothetical protein [Acinetobacter baumannii]OYD38525.1 hypothetical protein CFE65_08450 [Acinetobacter baumannii]